MSYIKNPERQLNKDQLSGYAGLDASGNGKVGVTHLGDGSANETTYLRGDQTWATPAGGAGSVDVKYLNYPSDTPYTVLSSDYVLILGVRDGPFTINLPDASSNVGKMYVLKKASGGDYAVTYIATGTDTIDFDTSGNISAPLDSITLVAGIYNDWYVI